MSAKIKRDHLKCRNVKSVDNQRIYAVCEKQQFQLPKSINGKLNSSPEKSEKSKSLANNEFRSDNDQRQDAEIISGDKIESMTVISTQDNQGQVLGGTTNTIVTRLLSTRRMIQCNFCLETRYSMQYYSTSNRKTKSCLNCLDKFKRWLIQGDDQGSINENVDESRHLHQQIELLTNEIAPPTSSEILCHSTSASRAHPGPKADASKHMVHGHELRKFHENCQHLEQQVELPTKKAVSTESYKPRMASKRHLSPAQDAKLHKFHGNEFKRASECHAEIEYPKQKDNKSTVTTAYELPKQINCIQRQRHQNKSRSRMKNQETPLFLNNTLKIGNQNIFKVYESGEFRNSMENQYDITMSSISQWESDKQRFQRSMFGYPVNMNIQCGSEHQGPYQPCQYEKSSQDLLEIPKDLDKLSSNVVSQSLTLDNPIDTKPDSPNSSDKPSFKDIASMVVDECQRSKNRYGPPPIEIQNLGIRQFKIASECPKLIIMSTCSEIKIIIQKAYGRHGHRFKGKNVKSVVKIVLPSIVIPNRFSTWCSIIKALTYVTRYVSILNSKSRRSTSPRTWQRLIWTTCLRELMESRTSKMITANQNNQFGFEIYHRIRKYLFDEYVGAQVNNQVNSGSKEDAQATNVLKHQTERSNGKFESKITNFKLLTKIEILRTLMFTLNPLEVLSHYMIHPKPYQQVFERISRIHSFKRPPEAQKMVQIHTIAEISGVNYFTIEDDGIDCAFMELKSEAVSLKYQSNERQATINRTKVLTSQVDRLFIWSDFKTVLSWTPTRKNDANEATKWKVFSVQSHNLRCTINLKLIFTPPTYPHMSGSYEGLIKPAKSGKSSEIQMPEVLYVVPQLESLAHRMDHETGGSVRTTGSTTSGITGPTMSSPTDIEIRSEMRRIGLKFNQMVVIEKYLDKTREIHNHRSI